MALPTKFLNNSRPEKLRTAKIIMNRGLFCIIQLLQSEFCSCKQIIMHQKVWLSDLRLPKTGNALERVQRVHEPADLWDITF